MYHRKTRERNDWLHEDEPGRFGGEMGKSGTLRLECADSEMTTQASRERQHEHLPISVRVSLTTYHQLHFFPFVDSLYQFADLSPWKYLVAAHNSDICSLLRQPLS